MANSFYCGRHIVSAGDFDRQAHDELFCTADRIKSLLQTRQGRRYLNTLLYRGGDPVCCIILHEGGSTRTVSSFARAAYGLGGIALPQPLQFTSFVKEETTEEMTCVLGEQWDVIVIRDDKRPDIAKFMADIIETRRLQARVINAGDGDKEHPTQMLLDIYTIRERRRRELENKNLVFALVGDLTHSRAIHSLLIGLNVYGGKIFLVGPESRNIPSWLTGHIENLEITKVEDPLSVAPLVDVWYLTRLQTNLNPGEYTEEEKKHFAKKYGASEELRGLAKEDALFLDPLPHGPKYPEGIDLIDQRFIHFPQAYNGLVVRMALLAVIFNRAACLPS